MTRLAFCLSLLAIACSSGESNDGADAGGYEICTNGVDDDGDEQIDCADSGCSTHAACVQNQENCTNDTDDDGDNLIDCLDPQCATQTDCTGTEICNNGVDDDNDDLIDCADTANASPTRACGGGTGEVCTNGTDDDGDSWSIVTSPTARATLPAWPPAPRTAPTAWMTTTTA
jgi:hypothetical protein